jgi:hypothetical protein
MELHAKIGELALTNFFCRRAHQHQGGIAERQTMIDASTLCPSGSRPLPSS